MHVTQERIVAGGGSDAWSFETPRAAAATSRRGGVSLSLPQRRAMTGVWTWAKVGGTFANRTFAN
jgi:hypothetical protein